MISKRFFYGLIFTVPLFSGTPVYLVNIGFESPTLVAPAVIRIKPTDDHRLFQFGMVGWTVLFKSEFGLNKNMAVGLSQDLSPMNSNASIYQYSNGKRDRSLDYGNSTYLTQLYLKKKHNRNLTTQFNLIFQKENVKDLSEKIEAFWDSPHFGYSITESWRNVGYEDFFNNHWDGQKGSVHCQFFPGENTWLKGFVSAGIGKKIQTYHTTVSAKYFFSENLNKVNQFIVGGVWELELLDFMPGSHYGEYRIDSGILINGRLEKTLTRSIDIGFRYGFLSTNKDIYFGHGVKIVKVHQGLVYNLGASISGDAIKKNDLHRMILSGGVTFGFM
jgi:hypothetical protein